MAQPVLAGHSVWAGRIFPNNGMLFLSALKSYSGNIFVEHNWIGCNSSERDRTQEVWNQINLSTLGWRNGVRMSNQGCGATLSPDGNTLTYSSNSMDSGIGWDQDREHFRQPDGSLIGGRIQRQEASPAFCAAWAVSAPCGHRPFIQINWNKWVGIDGGISGDPYRRREILHETGHSHGLEDCPGQGYYGMMMNGSCGWDEGITGWNADDLASVSKIYPK